MDHLDFKTIDGLICASKSLRVLKIPLYKASVEVIQDLKKLETLEISSDTKNDFHFKTPDRLDITYVKG